MDDDDAPLSALAVKQPAAKFDDDTPLASLADLKPKASQKIGTSPSTNKASTGKRPDSSPKAASTPGGGGKGRGRPALNRKASATSGSSSSSDSSTDSSDDRPAMKAMKVTKLQRLNSLNKRKLSQDGPAEDGGGAVRKKERTHKEQAVADLLCRWWYALPDWPPDDEKYYKEELAKKGYRKVHIQEWEWVHEEDEKGRKKVYELSQFRGVFRAANGDLIDLRPKETCPCFSQFMKKDLSTLYDLLVVAYEKQMEELKQSKYNESKLQEELKMALARTRERAYQARQLVGPRSRTA